MTIDFWENFFALPIEIRFAVWVEDIIFNLGDMTKLSKHVSC